MDYITGNKFKNFCHCYFDNRQLSFNRACHEDEILTIFIKTDFIDLFFQNFQFNRQVIIFTHNSDYGINSSHIKYLDIPNVISWYGQNIDIIHPKLKSIPIGIANEEWPHGDTSILEIIKHQNNKKTNLVYANFNCHTNPTERNHCVSCLNNQNIIISPPLEFKKYLLNLSQSYFSISPNGNGIDCHKTWESLYLKTIPIVTKSINSLQYKDFPIVILDDWSDFNINDFSIEKYDSIWYNFDTDKINFTNYVKSILHTQKTFN